MPKRVKGILHIQANSPNLNIDLIKSAFYIMKNTKVEEILTCDENYNQYGSLWGITREKINSYNMNKNIHDRKIIKPDCYLLDKSIDIHTHKEFKKSLKFFKQQVI